MAAGVATSRHCVVPRVGFAPPLARPWVALSARAVPGFSLGLAASACALAAGVRPSPRCPGLHPAALASALRHRGWYPLPSGVAGLPASRHFRRTVRCALASVVPACRTAAAGAFATRDHLHDGGGASARAIARPAAAAIPRIAPVAAPFLWRNRFFFLGFLASVNSRLQVNVLTFSRVVKVERTGFGLWITRITGISGMQTPSPLRGGRGFTRRSSRRPSTGWCRSSAPPHRCTGTAPAPPPVRR
ncbi:MAG: hypothetical protein RL490_2295 [Pseudomonadota bacterium]